MSEKFGGRHRRELIERVRNPSDLVRPVRACPVGPRSGGPISVRVDFSVRLGEVSVCGYFECGGSWRGGADTWVVRDARHALQDCCPALCRCPRGLRGLGVVGVAHSRVLCVGGDCGIMRDSNVSSDRGSAPMCIDPLHRTWEPDRRTRRSPENPVIPTKTSSRSAEASASHVQHRRQPRPTPRSVHFRLEIGPDQPGHPDVEARTANSGTKATCGTSEPLASSRSAAAQPISTRSTTDLGAEPDRSRAGLRPISVRKRTDLEPGYDRSRRGTGPISVESAELAAVGQAPCEGVTSSKPWLPVPWVRTGVHPRRGAAAEVAPSRER